MNDNALSLTVGGEVKVVGLAVSGQLFVFSPSQQNFMLNLQKLKNVTAAALSVGKDEAWGQAFLSSRKFKKYLNLKLKAFSDKNGLDVEWWYQFGKNLTDGYREFYKINCGYCEHKGEIDTYEAETFRNDDMSLTISCPACFKTVNHEYNKAEFKPSREQVEGWKTLGDRIIPKIERVSHAFENTEILFESEEVK